MRANAHAENVHAFQESAKTLKKDFADAGERLISDSKNLAREGKNELARFVKSALFLTGAAAFVVGGVMGYLMRRR